jgi:hypothetical protein
MSSLPSPKKSAPSSNSAGAKILVTAASLATVVGGWAALALQQSTLNTQESINVTDDSSQVVLDLPPLPTLVPEPSSVPTGILPNRPVSAPPISTPLTYAPYSTPVVNPPVVTAPSRGNTDSTQKGSTEKSGGKKAPKDPVSHTGSSK